MTNKAHTTNKPPEEILGHNPAVSKSIVSKYHELEKELHKLGVDTKSRYTLSPPLGGAVSYLSHKQHEKTP